MEDSLTEYELAENLNDIYRNPVSAGLKGAAIGLAEAIPMLGTVLGNAVDQGLEYFQNAKKKQLIDSILENKSYILPEQIDAVPFIVEFARTQEVINRLANSRKIQYICNLFNNYFIRESHGEDVDIFEEYLGQIQLLSYREIELLVYLYQQEKKLTHEHGLDAFERHKAACGCLRDMAKANMNLSAAELEGIMTSISKSGFCKEETGTRASYAGGVFYTTQYFERFLGYIMKRK